MKVIVIGSGPAVVTAALRARELGAEVTLVERRRMGGVGDGRASQPKGISARTRGMNISG